MEGLCLSGGGAIPGNFIAGGAPEIVKARPDIKYIIGVSAGAIIAAQIAAAVVHGNLDEVADVWKRKIRSSEDIWTIPDFLKNFTKLAVALNEEKVSRTKLLQFFLKEKDNILELKNLFKAPALFDNSPLIKLIDEELDMEAVMKSDIKVDAVCVSNEGKLAIFSNKNSSVEDFKKAIIASAALPVQLSPVKIGDKGYMDGGVLKSVVISEAVHNLCDRIFMFLAKPSKNEISISVDRFMTLPWLERIPFNQAIRSRDSMETTTERFEITNENIKKYEELKQKIFAALNLENQEIKEKIEQIFREAGFRFQKRHYVDYCIFKPEIILPGNNYNFNTEEMQKGLEYGREYTKRELKRLSMIP